MQIISVSIHHVNLCSEILCCNVALDFHARGQDAFLNRELVGVKEKLLNALESVELVLSCEFVKRIDYFFMDQLVIAELLFLSTRLRIFYIEKRVRAKKKHLK